MAGLLAPGSSTCNINPFCLEKKRKWLAASTQAEKLTAKHTLWAEANLPDFSHRAGAYNRKNDLQLELFLNRASHLVIYHPNVTEMLYPRNIEIRIRDKRTDEDSWEANRKWVKNFPGF